MLGCACQIDKLMLGKAPVSTAAATIAAPTAGAGRRRMLGIAP
ncbi:hypothetical protein NHF48_003715 [Sphingomonas sp. H160509]|nr:hypothetical protein [Sphingomonas sp. H160509]MDD1450292.1 hypothetical protein [Sphingomonas sp. H160509]